MYTKILNKKKSGPKEDNLSWSILEIVLTQESKALKQEDNTIKVKVIDYWEFDNELERQK